MTASCTLSFFILVEAETKGRTTTEMQTEETAIKQMFTVLNTKTEVGQ